MFITSHSRGHRIGIVGLQKTEGWDNNESERPAGGQQRLPRQRHRQRRRQRQQQQPQPHQQSAAILVEPQEETSICVGFRYKPPSSQMSPKRKPLERLGAAEKNPNGEGWRARMKLGDTRHSGPTRLAKATAEADLNRMRSVASRAKVPRVVAELHSEAVAEDIS